MLGNILSSGKLPHAFLFAGPRGTGKTSAARILAKYINCTRPSSTKAADGQRPCNQCEMCTSITLGSALDLVEIDAASNRGIDEIRDLRDKIKLAPLSAKSKVYIIDEVHMLTTEAFNALLKTLEEPPPHAVFVLCTTEMAKLPETIISRCTVIKFTRPTIAEIVAKLEEVSTGEKLKIKDPQLQLIAQAAKGSFRDAIKILEQVSASGQSVEQVLGMLESADPAQFIDHLRRREAAPALELVNQLVEQGVSLRGFMERCVEVLREQLLAQVDSSQMIVDSNLKLIEAFEKAYTRSKDAAVPQLPLEILVIEMTNPNSQAPNPNEISNTQTSITQKPTSNIQLRPSGSKSKYKLADVESKWQEILKAVRPKNHSVEALLRSTRPADFDGRTLVLDVFYKFHKDKLESDKCRVIVEETVGDVLGTPAVSVKLQLGQKTLRSEVSAEAIEEDIVKAAEEIFKVDAI